MRKRPFAALSLDTGFALWALIVWLGVAGVLVFWPGHPWRALSVLGIGFLLLWLTIRRRITLPLRNLLTHGSHLTPAIAELQRVQKAFAQLGRELQQAHSGLNDARARLHAVLCGMTDSVLAVDPNGHVLFVNDAARQSFGLTEETVLNRSVLEVVRNWVLAESLIATARTGEPRIVHFQVLTPKERTFEARTAPIRSDGKASGGAVAIMHDCTELRRLEKMRTDFVANVSHELRTPLTSIKGYIETILDDTLEANPVLTKRFLGIALQETDRMVRLVNDLLDLGRLESHDGTLQTHPVDLVSVAEEVIELYRSPATAKALTLALEVTRPIHPVLGDESLLRQLLINLVDNAVKYTPGPGRVTVTLSESDGHLELRVSDTGPGIPEKHLARLFERFYRVDTGRSRDTGGTGLGLSIVKHIVERHQGSVHVSSRLGQGATFVVHLPTAIREGTENAPPQPPNRD